MGAAVNTIAETVTTDALWGNIATIMPIALIVTMFALGFYLVRRQLKKVSKAKGGM